MKKKQPDSRPVNDEDRAIRREQMAIWGDRADELLAELKKIRPFYARIVRERLDLGNTGYVPTLRALGERCDLSVERMRQSQAHALRMLRDMREAVVCDQSRCVPHARLRARRRALRSGCAHGLDYHQAANSVVGFPPAIPAESQACQRDAASQCKFVRSSWEQGYAP